MDMISDILATFCLGAHEPTASKHDACADVERRQQPGDGAAAVAPEGDKRRISACSAASSCDADPLLPSYSESEAGETPPPAYEDEGMMTSRPRQLLRRRCSVYAVAGRWGITAEDAEELMQSWQDAQSGPISPIRPEGGVTPW